MTRFDEIESLCLQDDLDFGAAECHGILSGLICAAGPVDSVHWLTLLYEDVNKIDNNDRALLEQVYQQTMQQLSGDELGFQLMLPDDEQSLSQRTLALTDWCRGFLYGISAANLKLGPDLPDDVNEIIHDLTQISAADYSDDQDEDNNEAENAYMELTEYIRAGTMLIYTELQVPARPSPDSTVLH